MGSPPDEVGHEVWEREREVTLPYAFYLGRAPVTQRRTNGLTGENSTDHPDSSSVCFGRCNTAKRPLTGPI